TRLPVRDHSLSTVGYDHVFTNLLSSFELVATSKTACHQGSCYHLGRLARGTFVTVTRPKDGPQPPAGVHVASPLEHAPHQGGQNDFTERQWQARPGRHGRRHSAALGAARPPRHDRNA